MKRRKLLRAIGLAAGILTVALLANGFLTPPVIVSPEYQVYNPGSLVKVKIHANEGLNASSMWLFVDQPNNMSFLVTPLDPISQNYTFTLPDDAQPGVWEVTVTWDHQSAQTVFTVSAMSVPEFPETAALLFVVFIASLLLLRARRRI